MYIQFTSSVYGEVICIFSAYWLRNSFSINPRLILKWKIWLVPFMIQYWIFANIKSFFFISLEIFFKKASPSTFGCFWLRHISYLGHLVIFIWYFFQKGTTGHIRDFLIKVGLSPAEKDLCYLLVKMIKNAFYFILKPLSFSRYLSFCHDFLVI